MLKRKLKLTVTKIRRQKYEPNGFRAICPVCFDETEFVSADEAAFVWGIGRKELSELIGRGDIHIVRITGGSFRLCRSSLFEKFQK
jgi:hypothetical protein